MSLQQAVQVDGASGLTTGRGAHIFHAGMDCAVVQLHGAKSGLNITRVWRRF